jgi:thioredoxin-related protein
MTAPMRQFIPRALLVAAALTLLAVPGHAADDFDESIVATILYPDWFKESFLNLQDDLAEAREAGKDGLLLFFSTQGCSYCDLFIRTSLADPALAARAQAHFDTIGLEIFDDADLTDPHGKATRVKHFALDQGVEFSPTLLFLDGEGRAVLRLPGYYDPERFGRALDYVIGRHYEEEPFRNWLARQGAPALPTEGDSLIADPLFGEPPYALERKRIPAQRPLLVIFEIAGCPRCAQFHREVLRDSEVRSILEGMEVIRLDAEDTQTPVVTPSGERTTPAGWAEQQGFTQYPALAFFEEGGEQVLETDALVLKIRMLNALGFVHERAYEQGWTYQRFARSRALAKSAADPEQHGQ